MTIQWVQATPGWTPEAWEPKASDLEFAAFLDGARRRADRIVRRETRLKTTAERAMVRYSRNIGRPAASIDLSTTYRKDTSR